MTGYPQSSISMGGFSYHHPSGWAFSYGLFRHGFPSWFGPYPRLKRFKKTGTMDPPRFHPSHLSIDRIIIAPFTSDSNDLTRRPGETMAMATRHVGIPCLVVKLVKPHRRSPWKITMLMGKSTINDPFS